MAKLLRVAFLGGVSEIGKNITALEYSDSIIVVDVGMSFPTEETPGVDIIIPNFDYLVSNASKVKGVFLTHGHEDHIGAVPYLLKQLNVPVYGTAMTLGILAAKLDEHGIDKSCLHEVETGDRIAVDKYFEVEFIKVCHSISGACALSINTPRGIVFFTGDYKIDYTPIDGKLTDLARIADIGEEGVLLLLADSTNVEHAGHSQSERNVGHNLERIFSENKNKRLIISTFSSHNYRLQQIINLAEKYGRKLVLSGKSMRKLFDIAVRLGEIEIPPKMLIEQGEAKSYAPGKVVVISAGSQGESMSALTRMSLGDYKKVVIGEEDVVVMSSSAIPGNERLIYAVVNNLFKLGADVVYDSALNMHASGHCFQEEMKLMLTLLKPRYFAPVHGEYRHLVKHSQLAQDVGIAKENIIIPYLGASYGFDNYTVRALDNVPCGGIFVDSMDGECAGEELFRDRKSLSECGFITVVASVLSDGKLSEYEVSSRGFTISDEFAALLRKLTENALSKLDFKEGYNATDVKAVLKKAVRRAVADKYRKFPIIVPVLIEG